METVRIRDPGWKKVGSGIRDKHPGYATLAKAKLLKILKNVVNIIRMMRMVLIIYGGVCKKHRRASNQSLQLPERWFYDFISSLSLI
jgi:hypothetical protein